MKSRLIIITTAIILLAAILGGCGSDYETFTYEGNQNTPSFSFEYPRDFEEQSFFYDTVGGNEPDFAPIFRLGKENEEDSAPMEAVWIYWGPPGNTNPTTVIEGIVLAFNGENSSTSEIIHRDSLNFESTAAESAVFSSYENIYRVISFEDTAGLWIILYVSPSNNAEETKLYFQYLIETFRFLDNPD
jgi:hypothetical protein